MPTLSEGPEVAKLLATILTGEPVTHGALAVIPLLAPNLDDPDWLTLDDLLPPSPLRGDRACSVLIIPSVLTCPWLC